VDDQTFSEKCKLRVLGPLEIYFTYAVRQQNKLLENVKLDDSLQLAAGRFILLNADVTY
jgi:hypothetical protein